MNRLWLALCGALLACEVPASSADASTDGGAVDRDGGLSADGGRSGCEVTAMQIVCAPNIAQEPVNGLQRDVYWRAPHGNAPDAGWPAVIVYQGSFYGPSTTWGTVKSDVAFGGFQQARMQVSLLDQGYVVLAPAAAGVAWQTNMTLSWDLSTDKIVIDELLADLRAGKFGPIDTTRLYATGISSGGYMTSRMALSYPGVFRALVIQSASWATCGGSLCVLPSSLPADHPPTLFLHGQNDQIVPLSTAQSYVDALRAQHTEVELFVDPNAGHEWLHDSPERVSAWFSTH